MGQKQILHYIEIEFISIPLISISTDPRKE